LIRHGLRLANPGALEKHRAKVEARERRFAIERAHEAREAELLRQQQQRAAQVDASWNRWAERKIAEAREAKPFTDLQIDVHGMTIAEERKRERAEREAAIQAAIDALRRELTTAKRTRAARSSPYRHRYSGSETMALNPEVLDARMELRVAELRLLAAETFARQRALWSCPATARDGVVRPGPRSAASTRSPWSGCGGLGGAAGRATSGAKRADPR
jgi:hypothetical protein